MPGAALLPILLAASAAGQQAPPPALNETLRAAAARITPRVYMGSQFKGAQIADTTMPRYRATHSAQFDLSTVGNECKWGATHKSAAGLNLTECAAAKRYADSVGQAFRGHNLCWGNDNPAWLLEGKFSADQLRSILQRPVSAVMKGVEELTGTAPLAW